MAIEAAADIGIATNCDDGIFLCLDGAYLQRKIERHGSGVKRRTKICRRCGKADVEVTHFVFASSTFAAFVVFNDRV